jgi:hypothetical protein
MRARGGKSELRSAPLVRPESQSLPGARFGVVLDDYGLIETAGRKINIVFSNYSSNPHNRLIVLEYFVE